MISSISFRDRDDYFEDFKIELGEEIRDFFTVMIKKEFRVIAFWALALLTLSSCLEMESTISVKKDGSGTLTEKISMGPQIAGMLRMSAAQGGEDPLAQFKEESLKAKATEFGEGVEFVSVDREEPDGGLTITVVYQFKDLSMLSYAPGALMNEEEDAQDKMKVTFGLEGDVVTIRIPDPSQEDFSFGEGEMSDEELAMAGPMLAGMKVSSKIVFEDGILDTTASYREGNTIELMSIDLDGIMKNEGGLKALKRIDTPSRKEFEQVTKELKGFNMESQEKVTVKMK